MNNKKIRDILKANHIYLWQVAKFMGISEATMTRLMRTELEEEKKIQILDAVEQIKKEVNR